MTEGDTPGLTDIHISSGVNAQGKPFCTVTAESGKQIVAAGQLSPEEVRVMAKDWFGAAEAAESDALVFRLLRTVDLPIEAVGQFLVHMRKERETLYVPDD